MFKKIFGPFLTSHRNSGWVMKYINVYDCFDVCSWVQTHLVCVWESACGCACVRVCGSSSGLLKACWEACHCKSGKGKSPKCTEERTHHPPLSLSPFLHYSLNLSFSLLCSFLSLHFYCTFPVLWKCNFIVKKNEEWRVNNSPVLLLYKSLVCLFVFCHSLLLCVPIIFHSFSF